MKPGIRIINTARGELIDEAALQARHRERASSPAPALDVFEKEPPADWALAQAAAGRRDAAHRRVHRGSAGAGRPRHGRGGPRFPARRRRPQRRQLPVGASRRAAAAAAVDPARRSSGGDRRRRWAPARIEAIGAPLLRRAGREPGRRGPGVERRGRRAAADPVGRRLDRQRARGGPRARHRDHRVAQHAAAPLHQPGLDQAAHERRRALGRGHGLRAEQPAAGVGPTASTSRRRSRGTLLDHLQRRSAGRHRRGRHDSRPPRRQHRELRARAATRPARSASSNVDEDASAPARSTRRSRRSAGCPPSAPPGSCGCGVAIGTGIRIRTQRIHGDHVEAPSDSTRDLERASRPRPARRRRERSSARSLSMRARSICCIDTPRTRSMPPVNSRGSAQIVAKRDAPRTPPDPAARRRRARGRDAGAVAELRASWRSSRAARGDGDAPSRRTSPQSIRYVIESIRQQLARRHPDVGGQAAAPGARSKHAAMWASKPTPATLKNGRPPSSPASIDARRCASAPPRSRAPGCDRHAELARQAVARAGRHDRQRHVGPEAAPTHLVHRAVAAPGHHQPRAARRGAPRPARARVPPLGDEDARRLRRASASAARRAPRAPARARRARRRRSD